MSDNQKWDKAIDKLASDLQYPYLADKTTESIKDLLREWLIPLLELMERGAACPCNGCEPFRTEMAKWLK